MGVCLYLALMKKLLGDRFTFAVLDDVVMSVDAGHRKQFCQLLRAQFPNTQFVITTHDKAWARQLRYQGLVTSQTSAEFHGWSVEGGPVYEQSSDVWEKIDSDIAAGDIPAAAARLRRHLEYISTELAEGIAARIPYRADADHDLGELFSAVIGQQGELIKKMVKAAKSWGDAKAESAVQELRDARSLALKQHSVEQWVVNKAVHYNEWADFAPEDFQPAVEAVRDLIALFRCGSCGGWLHLSGPKANPEALRCNCNARSYNLRAK